MAAENNSHIAAQKEKNLVWMEMEMDYRVEFFNKLTQTCFNKCVDKNYKEADLYIGENACIDRCVSKYWQATNLIGHLLASGGVRASGIQ